MVEMLKQIAGRRPHDRGWAWRTAAEPDRLLIRCRGVALKGIRELG